MKKKISMHKKKSAEEMIRENAEKFQALFDQSADGVFLHDLAGNIIDVNEAAQLQTGYAKEELLGMKVSDLHTAEYLQRRSSVLQQWRDWPAGRKMLVETEHQHKNGRVYPVEINSSKIRIGRKELIVAMARDISERKASETEYSQLINGMNDTAFVIDFEGRFLEVNESAVQNLGYSKDALLSMGPSEIDPNLQKDEIRKLIEGMKQGEQQVFETQHRTASGSIIPVEVSSALIQYKGESAILSIARDISSRKRLEEQLQQAQKMEAIGQLAGGVAHDFNNLLTVINGYAEILMMEELPDQVKKPVEQIRQAGERAASLTAQLLAFSRKQIIQPVLINLNTLVSDHMKMLSRLLGEQIEIVTVFHPDLYDIKADPVQIEQLILNISLNSRDAMPAGGRLTIETGNAEFDADYVRNHAETQPGKYVMLAISDNGAGMDADVQARVFEPFFTTKERDKGTGLGLATVYGIVKQNDGFIYVYSEPQKGTAVKIYLPAAEDEQQKEENTKEDMLGLRGTETILLVEDDHSVRELTRSALSAYGYSVLTAADGEEALRVFSQQQGEIDLLLTDVIMPVMGGREIAEKLCAQAPQLKIIYFSGYTDNSIVHQGILEEGVEFIQKPFSNIDLAEKVRHVLDMK